MKLSISNLAWNQKDDCEVFSLMHKLGFEGLEIAPTKIFPAEPYLKLDEAKIWSEKLRKEYGFSVPSMQSIWYGKTEINQKMQMKILPSTFSDLWEIMPFQKTPALEWKQILRFTIRIS